MTAGVVLLALVGAGCSGDSEEQQSAGTGGTGEQQSTEPEVSAAEVSSNVRDGARGVTVDTVPEVTVAGGRLEKVSARIGRQRLAGELSKDGRTWTATERLEPGKKVRVAAVAVDAEGLEAEATSTFRTDDLTLEEQTFPSIAPLAGETVGVGMPVIVQFDVPVTDRASIEKHLKVTTSSGQKGAWSWLSDSEVHWRPKTYFEPGTEVTVDADINSVPAGNGVYGQLSRSTSFTVGDSVISKVDVASHRMRVYRNGQLLRTIPITAGKDGFVTRSGTKVIMEKVRHKKMDASTIGIEKDDPEYYNLDVEYAMRVTYSGEFIHGAPWSSGSQGSDNVSHGCVGMSMSDAAWLFDLSKRGDVVVVSGTGRSLEPGNGYTDWNISFADFKEGSALS
ncbi:MAG TPA: Ig-like domain-containing protein [Nocardioidaceae bacterium]|nr:Ig-like domain-containing protein [Nocardioidaceae bacterium]